MTKLNAYFTLMLDAKKNNQKSFEYKGSTYTQKKTKTGLVTYKKKGSKNSKRKSKKKSKRLRQSKRR